MSRNHRRGRGEGSVYQRSDGRWVGVLDLGWEGGRRRRKAVYASSKPAAQHRLAEIKRQHDAGLPVLDERQRVDQFLERWLQDVARVSLRPSTYRRYQELIRLHVIPNVGSRPLVRLSPQHLVALYSTKLQSGLSARTVGHIHRVLHRALADALRWGIVARNVCDAVRPPRPAPFEARTLSIDETAVLLSVAREDPLEALYVLAATGGLRQGELLALRWEDLDLDAGVMHVQRSIRRQTGQGFVEDEPKTASGRRNVALGAFTVDALRRHRARQLEVRLGAPKWEDRDLVFPDGKGDPMDGTTLLKARWYPLLDRAGLSRIRFHDLRHTAASLMLAQGVHPKVVQERLGHSRIGVTMDTYSHVAPHLQREAAASLDDLIESRIRSIP